MMAHADSNLDKGVSARADEAALDQCLFSLDHDAHQVFLDLLDNPPQPSAELRALMRRTPVWESGIRRR